MIGTFDFILLFDGLAVYSAFELNNCKGGTLLGVGHIILSLNDKICGGAGETRVCL